MNDDNEEKIQKREAHVPAVSMSHVSQLGRLRSVLLEPAKLPGPAKLVPNKLCCQQKMESISIEKRRINRV